MREVPTNSRDLDSYIVAAFSRILDEHKAYEAKRAAAIGDPSDYIQKELTRDDIGRMLNPTVSVAITDFLQQACDGANVEYGPALYGLRDQATADYVDGYGSGSQRRSVLYKMCNDARAIIATLPKIEVIIFEEGDKSSNRYDFKIDDDAMALINKTLQKGHNITKKYQKDPGPYSWQKNFNNP